MELISVVVATYNSAATIIETLESIKKQTYPNIEIVVTDDCSKDNTVAIVKEWMNNNSVNIKVLANSKNKGVPGNVNTGIRATSGNIIKFFAGDDILLPNAISEYYSFYKSDKSVIWQSRFQLFGLDEERMKNIEESLPDYAFFEWDNYQQYKALCVYNRIAAPALGLIHKDVLMKCGCFDERYPLIDDYPFILKLSKEGFCFRLIDYSLVKYRISEKSVTGKPSKQYYKCMRDIFFKMRFWGMIKTRSWNSLIKQFIRYCINCFDLEIVKINGNIKIVRIR